MAQQAGGKPVPTIAARLMAFGGGVVRRAALHI